LLQGWIWNRYCGSETVLIPQFFCLEEYLPFSVSLKAGPGATLSAAPCGSETLLESDQETAHREYLPLFSILKSRVRIHIERSTCGYETLLELSDQENAYREYLSLFRILKSRVRTDIERCTCGSELSDQETTYSRSVADANPDPDPHVFGPPGSGSISQPFITKQI
jgi:hypothetical protein